MADETISITIPDAKKTLIFDAFARIYGVRATAGGVKARLATFIRDAATAEEQAAAAQAAITDKSDTSWGTDLQES